MKSLVFSTAVLLSVVQAQNNSLFPSPNNVCDNLDVCVAPNGTSGNCFNPNHFICCPDGSLAAQPDFVAGGALPGFPTTCPGENNYFVTWSTEECYCNDTTSTLPPVELTSNTSTPIVTTGSPASTTLPIVSAYPVSASGNVLWALPECGNLITCVAANGTSGNCFNPNHFYCCPDGSLAAQPMFESDGVLSAFPTTCPGENNYFVTWNITDECFCVPDSTTPPDTDCNCTPANNTSTTPVSQNTTTVTTCPTDAPLVCNVVDPDVNNGIATSYCYNSTQYYCNPQTPPYSGEYLCPATAPNQCGRACYNAATSGLTCQVSTTDPYGSSQLVSDSSTLQTTNNTFTITFINPTNSTLEYVIVHYVSSAIDSGVQQNTNLLVTSNNNNTYSITLDIPIGSTIQYAFTYAVNDQQTNTPVSTDTSGPISSGGITPLQLNSVSKSNTVQQSSSGIVGSVSMVTLVATGAVMLLL